MISYQRRRVEPLYYYYNVVYQLVRHELFVHVRYNTLHTPYPYHTTIEHMGDITSR